MKKIILFVTAVILVAILSGCTKEEELTKENNFGLTIEEAEAFEELLTEEIIVEEITVEEITVEEITVEEIITETIIP